MRRAAALALLVALAACGPIEYVNQVTRHASTSVEAARAANAEKFAPYWWTRAVEYLRQARVLAARAHWQSANRFGRLSNEAAIKAREEAISAQGYRTDTDPSTPLRAGKETAP